jgi:hypothetical protein
VFIHDMGGKLGRLGSPVRRLRRGRRHVPHFEAPDVLNRLLGEVLIAEM